MYLMHLSKDLNFNPRSRVGNDSLYLLLIVCVLLFQSTFPRGERPCSFRYRSMLFLFQSTFPRGERQIQLRMGRSWHGISIHVPAWGTTDCYGQQYCGNKISIHVPAWGTTRISRKCCQFLSFQSTFPRGERLHTL